MLESVSYVLSVLLIRTLQFSDLRILHRLGNLYLCSAMVIAYAITYRRGTALHCVMNSGR
jgi:hypothetical protein